MLLVRVSSRGLVVTHVLDQVRLEDFFASCLLLAFVPHRAAEVLLVDRGATIVSQTSLYSFLVLILDAESIKHEHPLVHLEFVDVQLGHEFHNLDGLLRLVVRLGVAVKELVSRDAAFLGNMHAWIGLGIAEALTVTVLSLFEDLDKLSYQMGP